MVSDAVYEHALAERDAAREVAGDYREGLNAALARVAELEQALRHYADEGTWEDHTPDESVNTAGYLLFTYGPDDVPWRIARAASSGSGPAWGPDHPSYDEMGQ